MPKRGGTVPEEVRQRIRESHKARGGWSEEHKSKAYAARMAKRQEREAENERRGGRECSVCKMFKSFSEFYLARNRPCLNGHEPRCKVCTRAKAKEWNKRYPERHLAHEWNYKLKSPQKARTRDVRAKFKRYGMTYEEGVELLSSQNGLCAICAKALTMGKGDGCQVDHCHKTGKVRGLLCGHCNSALGYLRDDPSLAIKAADYLAGYTWYTV